MTETFKAIDTMTFEEAIEELETITSKLSEGSLSLRDSVKSYERGVALIKFCRQEVQLARDTIATIEDDTPKNTEVREPEPTADPFGPF